MARKTYAQLTTAKDEIKNETTALANTATRVGTMFESAVDSMVNYRLGFDASGDSFPDSTNFNGGELYYISNEAGGNLSNLGGDDEFWPYGTMCFYLGVGLWRLW
jgi:hypothetical protein